MEIIILQDLMLNRMRVNFFIKLIYGYLIILLVSLICNARVESHPENTVGLLTMAGKGYVQTSREYYSIYFCRVELLVSPTENTSKLLAAFNKISANGKSEFSTSVQIAQLALKHRKNKNGGQRIIVFIGSPIIEDSKNLVKIGKLLKKNNIAVDVVIMGEQSENLEKMEEFVKATSGDDNNR